MPRGPSTFSFSFFPVPSNVLSVLTFVHLILFFAVAATHTRAEQAHMRSTLLVTVVAAKHATNDKTTTTPHAPCEGPRHRKALCGMLCWPQVVLTCSRQYRKKGCRASSPLADASS